MTKRCPRSLRANEWFWEWRERRGSTSESVKSRSSYPTHKLRPTGDDFKIFFKKVLLVNGDEYIDNLTFLV